MPRAGAAGGAIGVPLVDAEERGILPFHPRLGRIRRRPGLGHACKRISYQAILEVRDVPNTWKNRPGGSGDFVYRLNWDPHRRRKDRALVIYLRGKTARPASMYM